MTKFENVVSLGHFCSPSMEFERILRRDKSLPFDWLITPDFSSVIDLIKNGFKDFLNEDYLFQFKQYPAYYRNIKSGMDFYHDFSPFVPFEKQIAAVKEKYDRRILRFYETVKSPTLFCRYITKNDLQFISENYTEIDAFFKSYNPLNEIIYVANIDDFMDIPQIKVYYVEKDRNDTVSRRFLDKNNELKKYILQNVTATNVKPKPNEPFKLFEKCYKKLRLFFGLVYRHDKII